MTIKKTADADSYSSYDSVSATDLTVGPINIVTVTDTDTDIDTSSCDPNDAFSQQLRIGRAVLWYLLLFYIKVLCASNNCANKSMIVRFYF